MRLRISSAVVLFCLLSIRWAEAEATLFLGEPYSYDGALAGTGHAAVYLTGVCAVSPVVLRLCAQGEVGVVLSRYRGIGGYDWIAIPLIPYLYAVETLEDVPLFSDKNLISILRDRYRRRYLASIVPDLPSGETPSGAWYQLIGASYLRTIYAFEIETSPEQDGDLIRLLSERSNRQHWNLITANCADFAREIISFYHPHSVHRSIIGDLGVTTPKQLARTLYQYSTRNPELHSSKFVIPQVPGTIPRSKRVRGVFEVMLTSKKYMLPLFFFHPYAAATAVAIYVGNWHFNPGKDALIVDSNHQLAPALTRAERHVLRQQLKELVRTEGFPASDRHDRLRASTHRAAEPSFDATKGSSSQVLVITRSNISNIPTGSEFAVRVVQTRLQLELKAAGTRKIARTDVESDLALLRHLLVSQHKELAIAPDMVTESTAHTLTSIR